MSTEIQGIVASYFANPNNIRILFQLNDAFLVANCVKSLGKQQKCHISFLAGFFLMVISGFGGAILNSLLISKPQIFFYDDSYLYFYMLAWILMLYSPFDLTYRITNLFPITIVANVMEALFVSGFLMDGVETGLQEFPNSFFAPIIIGTLSACGGSILSPFFVNQCFGRPVQSSELSEPTLNIKAPFLISLFYLSTKMIEISTLFTFQVTDNFNHEITPVHIVRILFVALYLYIFFWQQSLQREMKDKKKKD